MSKYRITSDEWAGLAKLAEECSEVAQAALKIMGGTESPEQIAHLEDEIGDLRAALQFFCENNGLDEARIYARYWMKFSRWSHKRRRRELCRSS